MRRTVTMSLALLLLAAPVQAQSAYLDTLTVALPSMQRLAAAAKALGTGLTLDRFDELDAASDEVVAVLDAHPPEPCYAGWWGDLRASAMLSGEIAEAMARGDSDTVLAYLAASSFLMTHGTDALQSVSCS